ncbi:MAG: TRAM domain-containing protein [Verrucomicrobiota bacterium]|nr:TRAM domain-containing protein [Verrucomicrobiota bacterium]
MRTLELQINDVAFGGNGVGRDEGKAVFVPFTIDGEQVRARVVREKKQFAEADLVEVLTASEKRTLPECPYFGRCGGCRYQHIEYAHQLEIKRRQVEQSLRRIGRIMDITVQPMIPSPKPYAYRNRVTVHCDDGVIGYFRYDAHELIDVEQCPIASAEVNAALAELRARKPRDGHYTLRAHSGPRVFEQTNDEVADALASCVAAMLPDDHQILIDAYCGAGFFTKRLAAKFQRVIGIEWDRHAIAAAEQNAAPNESYINGDVESELSRQLLAAAAATTSMIVDPPATGLSTAVRRALLDRPMHTLVYVSCDPGTMARDLKELQARFQILAVTPLDMFPQTAEIECAVHLRAA